MLNFHASPGPLFTKIGLEQEIRISQELSQSCLAQALFLLEKRHIFKQNISFYQPQNYSFIHLKNNIGH